MDKKKFDDIKIPAELFMRLLNDVSKNCQNKFKLELERRDNMPWIEIFKLIFHLMISLNLI